MSEFWCGLDEHSTANDDSDFDEFPREFWYFKVFEENQ